MNRYCHELENAEEVVLKDYKYIERIAHKFIKQSRNREELKNGLVQQGCIGLLEARERFDVSKNPDGFWTYACKFVSGRMKDFTIHSPLLHLKRH